MSELTFNHTHRAEAATRVVFDLPCREMALAGGVWIASPPLVGSRI